MDLAEFLLARIAEDEELARQAAGRHPGGTWVPTRGMSVVDSAKGHMVIKHSWPLEIAHITRHDPARVLAECAAKRAIVEEYRASAGPSYEDADVDYDAGRESGLEAAVRLLASPYAAHPDYRPEWAPTG